MMLKKTKFSSRRILLQTHSPSYPFTHPVDITYASILQSSQSSDTWRDHGIRTVVAPTRRGASRTAIWNNAAQLVQTFFKALVSSFPIREMSGSLEVCALDEIVFLGRMLARQRRSSFIFFDTMRRICLRAFPEL